MSHRRYQSHIYQRGAVQIRISSWASIPVFFFFITLPLGIVPYKMIPPIGPHIVDTKHASLSCHWWKQSSITAEPSWLCNFRTVSPHQFHFTIRYKVGSRSYFSQPVGNAPSNISLRDTSPNSWIWYLEEAFQCCVGGSMKSFDHSSLSYRVLSECWAHDGRMASTQVLAWMYDFDLCSDNYFVFICQGFS